MAVFPREIQGRWFENVAEAAAHFGVSRHAVYQAIKRGREGRLGVGSGKYERPQPEPKPKPKPDPAPAPGLTPLERMRRAARAESAAMRRVGRV